MFLICGSLRNSRHPDPRHGCQGGVKAALRDTTSAGSFGFLFAALGPLGDPIGSLGGPSGVPRGSLGDPPDPPGPAEAGSGLELAAPLPRAGGQDDVS